MRVLEGEEEPPLRALVGPHLDDVLPVEQDLAARDLVGRVAHDRVGQGGLAGAVRAHDGMRLARVHGEVDTLDDLGAVLERDVQVLELQLCHFVLPDSFQLCGFLLRFVTHGIEASRGRICAAWLVL